MLPSAFRSAFHWWQFPGHHKQDDLHGPWAETEEQSNYLLTGSERTGDHLNFSLALSQSELQHHIQSLERIYIMIDKGLKWIWFIMRIVNRKRRVLRLLYQSASTLKPPCSFCTEQFTKYDWSIQRLVLIYSRSHPELQNEYFQCMELPTAHALRRRLCGLIFITLTQLWPAFN